MPDNPQALASARPSVAPVAYRTILELASDPITIRDQDGWFVDVNTAACRMLGYERHEYLALHVADVAPPEANPGLDGRMTRLKAGETVVGLRRLRHRDGQLIDAENSSQVLPGGLILTISRDLTARRRLDEERQRLVAAVEQATESIAMLDADGNVTWANPSFARLHGFTADDGAPVRPGELLRTVPSDPGSAAEIAAAMVAEEPWAGRVRHRRRDGGILELDLSISPLRGDQGRIVGWVEIGRDIGRERILEEQLRQAQKMEAVGRLAGGIAHDFNNLLAGIRGFAELIHEDAPPGGDAHEMSGEIVRAADRGGLLASRLLSFARQRGAEPVVVDLGALVDAAEPLLREVVDERVHLSLRRAAQALPVSVDPGQLEQALVNLVINARDAIPDRGSIELSTQLEEVRRGHRAAEAGLADGPYALLSVVDSGTGIALATLPLIFEPFFTTKQLNRGAGLGLSIVYSFVTAAGGRILVDANPGAGARFDLYLPLAADQAPEDAELRAPDPVVRAERGLVLVVDDEPSITSIVGRMLQRAGYPVATAASAEAALELMDHAAVRPTMLVSDILLPGLNGLALARAARDRLPGLPVLFISGYEGDSVAGDAARAEGLFLQKPFTADELLKAVRAGGVPDGGRLAGTRSHDPDRERLRRRTIRGGGDETGSTADAGAAKSNVGRRSSRPHDEGRDPPRDPGDARGPRTPVSRR